MFRKFSYTHSCSNAQNVLGTGQSVWYSYLDEYKLFVRLQARSFQY